MNDDIVQRFFDSRILKLKSCVKQAAGNHALAFEQDRTEFTENQSDHKAWCGQNGWTVQYFADGLPKVPVADRPGRAQIERAGYFFMFQQENNCFREILNMDPGKPLTSTSQRTTQKEFKKGNHLPQRSSVWTQHNTEAGDDNARIFS